MQTINVLEEPAENAGEVRLAKHFESAFGVFSGHADKTAVLA